MRSARFSLIIIVLVIILIVTAIILNNCTDKGVDIVNIDKSKPPIDTNRPSVTETASFALG